MKSAKSAQPILYADTPQEIGERIKFWRSRQDPALTQKELGQKCGGLSRDQIGKIERGDVDLSTHDAFLIAQVFEKTVEELCSGCQPKGKEIENRIELGLSGEAQRYLKAKKDTNKEYIDLLNLLLSDEALADSLFRTILIYLNAQMIRIEPLVDREKEKFVYVNTKVQKDMITSLVTQRLSKLLPVIYDRWEYKMLPETAAKIKKLKRKNEKSKTKISRETLDRMERKAAEAESRQKYKVFDITQETKGVDETLKRLARQVNAAERYAKLEQLLKEDGET